MLNNMKLALAGCATLALSCSVAMADGMPAKGGSIKDAPVAPTPFSWSGIYVGGNVGVGWSENTHTVTFASNNATERFAFDPTSWVGGVQIGAQRQMGNLVLGLETGITGGSFNERRVATVVPNTARVSDIDWLFTLTPRIGYATSNWMAYFKGGYASAEVFRGTERANIGFQLTGNNRREDGWTVGGGVAFAVTPFISLGLDYSYVNLDVKPRPTQFVAGGVTLGTAQLSDVDMHLLTARVNFKLGN